MASSPQVRSIQYLRAVAVLLVVTFHALQWQRVDFEVGASGVDIFFVISGFVIWTVTAGREAEPLRFVRRRAARVMPLYWLATAFAMVAVTFWPHSVPFIEFEPRHVILSLLMIPHLDPRGLPFPVLDVGWTLGYEAFFYVVFAACLLVEEARRAQAVTMALVATVMLGFAVPPLYLIGANMMLLEFIAGVWLARAWRAGMLPGVWVSIGLLVLGFGAIAAQHLAHIKDDFWRPLQWGIPAVMIVAGALGVEKAGRLPRWPWLERLGDASYSIYLVHTLTESFIDFRPLWLLFPTVIVTGTAAGLIVRRWIEIPLLRLFGALPHPRTVDTKAAAAS